MSSFPRPFQKLEGGVSPLSVRDVGRSGRLDIRFSVRRGRTVLSHQYHEVPFKVSKAHYVPASPLARVIVMHSTAGLFGGDRLEARIHVEAGAQALVTSQSATKVHPSGISPACQSLRISVETGGELHYYVDPVIPFADSRLQQETRIELGSGARFYYWDGLMAGRVRRGESWSFAEMRSQTAVLVDAELAYLDRFELRPGDQSPTRRWAMGRYSYIASAFAYDPFIDAGSLDSMRSTIASPGPGLVYGLDLPFDRLMVGRFLANNGARVRLARDRYQKAVLTYLSGYSLSRPGHGAEAVGST